MKIGFIGLGIMGVPMAGHLQAGGHQLFVNDIRPAPAALTDFAITSWEGYFEVPSSSRDFNATP